MSYVDTLPSCCGIYELSDLLDDPEENIHSMLKHLTADYDYTLRANDRLPFIVFTDARFKEKGEVAADTRGSRLEKYLKKNKLGTIIRSGFKKSPVHGNPVQIWVFRPSWSKITKKYSNILKRMAQEEKPWKARYDYFAENF